MTDEFLEFSKAAGNDLSTPQPEAGFLASLPAAGGACARPAGRRRSTPASPRQSSWRRPTRRTLSGLSWRTAPTRDELSAWLGRVGEDDQVRTKICLGDVAQLARAPALQAGSRGFESRRLHFPLLTLFVSAAAPLPAAPLRWPRCRGFDQEHVLDPPTAPTPLWVIRSERFSGSAGCRHLASQVKSHANAPAVSRCSSSASWPPKVPGCRPAPSRRA